MKLEIWDISTSDLAGKEATERLVGEHGFERTSLSMICTEAGLTSGAFYARFDRKEDLAMALWERMEPSTGGIVDHSGSLQPEVLATEMKRLLMSYLSS